MQQFDFDYWSALYEDDPEEFETRRKQMIKSQIETAPIDYQQRLKGLMFEVDNQRTLSKNALDSCIKISGMMWKSLSELQTRMTSGATPQQQEAAVVIPLRANQS
ncbi:MAG: DUF3135 domain-containing protein [bacterium]